MENKDKIYEQFKDAADKAEAKNFARMDAVWDRVEEKLDEKKTRRGIAWWKYSGAAAILLLFISIGNLIVRNDADPIITPNAIPENNVTVIDTQKIKETFSPDKEILVEEEVFVNENSKPDYYKYNIGDTIHYPNGGYGVVISKSNNKLRLSAPSGEYRIKGEITKKATVWNHRSDKGKFRITGEITEKDSEDVYYMKGTRFTTSKDIDNPEYYFYTNKIKFIPGEKRDDNITTVSSETFKGDKSIVLRGRKTNTSGDVNNVYVEKKSEESVVLLSPRYLKSIPEQKSKKNYRDGDKSTLNAKMDNDQKGDNNYDKYMYENYYRIGSDEGWDLVSYEDDMFEGDTIPFSKTTKLIGVRKQWLYMINDKPVDKRVVLSLDSTYISSIKAIKYKENNVDNDITNFPNIIKIETKELNREERKKLKELEKEYQWQGLPKIQVDTEDYEAFEENKFENPAVTPLSTFSIDVDNASYTNIRRFLNNGQTVPKDAVRVEEMINFFKYQYPQPKNNEPFSINTEYSDAPWNPKHKLLKIGLQGKSIPTNELPASNFVFLIDVSGSMSDQNKLPLLKESMKMLVNQMRAKDRIAIVVYAGAAGLVLPSTGGDDKDKIITALENLNAGGSTAGGEGIELAYKTAQENFIKKGNNRVILATDGDFNVGASSNTDMQTLIEEKRKSGVFLTCLGYGMGNYKDSKMEILADKGNGNYAYIDNMQEADRFLQKEFKGSMYAIAKDVKIQIEFNPKHVQSYRLIGYENRKLRDEDFANDAIDAGELGSGHTVTALYEIIPTGVESDYFTNAPELKYSQPATTAGTYNDELATIKFRHKKPDEDVSKEIVKVISNNAVPLEQATGDFKFSAAVAWFGLKLRDSELIPNKETKAISELAKEGIANDPDGYRAEFIRLVNMVE